MIISFFFSFLDLILLFFCFLLFNPCMYHLFFLLKGEGTVKFERFNLVFWSWRQGDQLNIVTQVVGLISWWPERLFRKFQFSHFWSGSPTGLIRFHRPPLWIVFFICWFVCFVDCYVTRILYNCLLEMSGDATSSHDYNNAHIYTHMHTYSHTYTHSYTYIKLCQ